jgi:hypothetical protein
VPAAPAPMTELMTLPMAAEIPTRDYLSFLL